MRKCIEVALSEYKEGQYPLGAMIVDENGEPKLELYKNILEEECKKLLDEEYVKNINSI